MKINIMMNRGLIGILLILTGISSVITEVVFLPQIDQVMKQGGTVELVCGIDLIKAKAGSIRDLYWGLPNENGTVVKLNDNYKTERINIAITKNEKEYKKLMIIKNLQQSDEKIYQCGALSDEGFTASAIQLKLKNEEEVDKEVHVEIPRLPQKLDVKKFIGDSVDFTCGVDVSNTDPSHIQDTYWSKYNPEIEDWDEIYKNTSKYTVIPERTSQVFKTVLKIKNLELSDAGDYDCAIAPFADVGFALRLEVEKIKRPDPNRGIPTLSQNRYIVKQVGDTIELTCGVDYDDVDESSVRDIEWRKPNERGHYKKIQNSTRITVVTEKTSKYFKKVLTMKNLQKRDTEHYQCRLSLIGGQFDGFTTALDIQDRIAEVDIVKTGISFLPQSGQVVGEEGGTISFDCGLNLTDTDVDSVRRVLWTKYADDGSDVEIEENSKFIVTTVKNREILKKTLTVKNLEESDQRDYICLIETNVGQFPLHVKLTVKEREIVEVPFLPQQSHLIVLVNDTVELTCGIDFTNFEASLIKDIKWQKYEGNLLVEFDENAIIPVLLTENKAEHFKKTLVLKKLELSDSGQYFCSVYTKNKRFGFEITLEVEKPIEIPFIPVDQQRLMEKYEGDTVELICGVDLMKINSTLVQDVYWIYQDGKKSSKISKNTARRSISAESNSREYKQILRIKNLEEGDARLYGCVVSTPRRDSGFSIELKVKKCTANASEPIHLSDDEKIISLDVMIESLIFAAESLWYDRGKVTFS